MPNIGVPELIVIGMILVLVFGASRLPQLGASMGRAVRSIKRSLDNDPRIDVQAEAGAAEGRGRLDQPPVPKAQENPANQPPRQVGESAELTSKRQLAGEISDAELVSPAPKNGGPKAS